MKFRNLKFKSVNRRLFAFILVLQINFLYSHNTAFSQNIENSVLFFIAPGISSTLSSKNSEFDHNYFYVWSPYLNLTSELIYQQSLNTYLSLNIGMGLNFLNYELNHVNYLIAFDNEHISKKISCIGYKIPIYLKYELNLKSIKGNIYTTLGAEINFINAYSESSSITSGSGNDSTLHADYTPYAINSSLRAGLEFNNFFKMKYLNFFAVVVYQLRPYGKITILNSYTDISSNLNFEGNLYPKQISLYFGLYLPLLQNL